MLPVLEKKVRHGTKFNVLLSQIAARKNGIAAGGNDATGQHGKHAAAIARIQPGE